MAFRHSPSPAAKLRAKSGILTPKSEGSTNCLDLPQLAVTDAKALAAQRRALDEPVVIKPHPPNLTIKPRILQALMLLPRQALPLHCLDLASPTGGLYSGRFIELKGPIIDGHSWNGTSTGLLLIARNEHNGMLFAIERSEGSLCTVCKLGMWVNLGSLQINATSVCTALLESKSPQFVTKDLLLKSTATTTTTTTTMTPQLQREQKKKRVAIEAIQSLVKKRARSQSICATEMSHMGSLVDTNVKDDSFAVEAQDVEMEPSTQTLLSDSQSQALDVNMAIYSVADSLISEAEVNELFDTIRNQYFELLYKSLGSLAYFAKGPLSRARASFQATNSVLNIGSLVDFLTGLVLTTVQIDKKYRESIPNSIAQMKAFVDSSDEARRAKKRGKSRKQKISKTGLYPHEEDLIQRWWSVNKPEVTDANNAIPQPLIRSRVSILRNRETELQMIIIMEILALERLNGTSTSDGSSLSVATAESSAEVMTPVVRAKKRNKHNFSVLLDVHADRLCIWQSTVLDEVAILGDSQDKAPRHNDTTQRTSSEPLRDFCIDIIHPFFSARLPDLCESLNRKLGGPVMLQQEKSRLSRTSSSSRRERKPGEVTKRPVQQQKPTRTLQRALTNEQSRRSVSRGPSSAIALLRSATSTAIPVLKREDNDSIHPLSTLSAESLLKPRIGGSLSRSSSVPNLGDVRTKHKAMIDVELKSAITTLRKPNRGLVGKAISDAAEQRARINVTALRKTTKPRVSRPIPTAATVQVQATPANNRFRDVFDETGADNELAKLHLAKLFATEDRIPSSSTASTSFIPGTETRRGLRDSAIQSRGRNAIFETPTKGIAASPDVSSAIHTAAADLLATPLMQSPLMARSRSLSAFHTPSNKIGRIIPGEPDDLHQQPLNISKPSSRTLFHTPLKSRSAMRKDGSRATAQPLSQQENQPPNPQSISPVAISPPVVSISNQANIYQQLGWDDDDDLL